MVKIGGANPTHDIQLKDLPSGGSTDVAFVLAKDKSGRKIWSERRKPPFGARRSEGAVGYADLDPGHDLVFSQSDWSGGALQALYSPQHPDRYANADGVDMRWSNLAALGMQISSRRMDFIIRNGDAEDTSTAMWTNDANGAISRDTAVYDTGSASWKLHVTSPSGAGVSFSYITVANPTAYQGREITVYGRVRGDGGALPVRLRIADSVGSTDSAGVTAATWTTSSVTRTIDAAATYVRIGIAKNYSGTPGAEADGWADDIFVVPTGGLVCGGIARLASNLYGIFGRAVCQWDETNDKWDAVYVHASATATSIVEYNGNIYVAFGNGDNAYIYGSGTSWTVSTIAGDAQYAHFFAVSRGTLWKSRYDGGGTHNVIASSTNPINGGSWSSEYTVGSSDRKITGLYDILDTVVGGKEDGLHYYLRVYEDGTTADTFANATNEYRSDPDSENFQRGAEFKGRLYLAASQQSFYFFDLANVVDLSGLLFSPRLTDFGGRIRAMAADTAQLWMLMDTPTSDTSATKETWLLSLRPRGNDILVHTVEKVNIGDINALGVHAGYLWALGRLYNTTHSVYRDAVYRWTLPSKSVAPALDASPVINTTGSFESSVWDNGLPDTQKAFINLTIFVKPSVMDAEHTIVAKFRLDGASSWTTLGTFNGSGAIQTKYFNAITNPETNAVGKTIQLRFEFNTDDSVSPEMYAFSLHANLRTSRVRLWDVYVKVGNELQMLNGQKDTVKAATKLTNLRTLEAQTYPIELSEAFYEETTANTYRVQIVEGSMARVPDKETEPGVEVWKFEMQEVTVA